MERVRMSRARDFAVRYLRDGRPLTSDGLVEVLEEFEKETNLMAYKEGLKWLEGLPGGHQLNGRLSNSQEPNPASPVAGGSPMVADCCCSREHLTLCQFHQDPSEFFKLTEAFSEARKEIERLSGEQMVGTLEAASKKIIALQFQLDVQRGKYLQLSADATSSNAQRDDRIADLEAKNDAFARRLKQTEEERDRLKLLFEECMRSDEYHVAERDAAVALVEDLKLELQEAREAARNVEDAWTKDRAALDPPDTQGKGE
jgi:hypothetical protein